METQRTQPVLSAMPKWHHVLHHISAAKFQDTTTADLWNAGTAAARLSPGGSSQTCLVRPGELANSFWPLLCLRPPPRFLYNPFPVTATVLFQSTHRLQTFPELDVPRRLGGCNNSPSYGTQEIRKSLHVHPPKSGKKNNFCTDQCFVGLVIPTNCFDYPDLSVYHSVPLFPPRSASPEVFHYCTANPYWSSTFIF